MNFWNYCAFSRFFKTKIIIPFNFQFSPYFKKKTFNFHLISHVEKMNKQILLPYDTTFLAVLLFFFLLGHVMMTDK